MDRPILMCDYCGCRLQPAITELSNEHERLLDLSCRLRQLAAAGAHRDALEAVDGEFAALLERHTVKEERGIFTQLRSCWEADHRLDDLVGEHRAIEALLEQVRAGSVGWQRAVARLATDLAEHIFAEEVDLFPYAMYELTDAQWRKVAETHATSAPSTNTPRGVARRRPSEAAASPVAATGAAR